VKILSVILLVCAICLRLSAEGDTLTLINVNGREDPSGHVYIDPYQGILNSTSMNINCVDPNHDSYLNTSWTVNVTNLTRGNLHNTLLVNNGLKEELIRLFKHTLKRQSQKWLCLFGLTL